MYSKNPKGSQRYYVLYLELKTPFINLVKRSITIMFLITVLDMKSDYIYGINFKTLNVVRKYSVVSKRVVSNLHGITEAVVLCSRREGYLVSKMGIKRSIHP